MAQQNIQQPVFLQSNKVKLIPKKPFLVFLFVLLLGMIPVEIISYQTGFLSGEQHMKKAQLVTRTKSDTGLTKKITGTPHPPTPTTSVSATTYSLQYLTPPLWKTMIWHPDLNETENVILSPDYTAQNDPNPQTGLVILIYQFPDQESDIKQFRGVVEEVEDNLKSITQTEIGGFPTFHAIFASTDSNRILDDYHILKGEDHWVVRFVLPGNSLTAAQTEEQKYRYQITNLLQSIQFKDIQKQ